MKQKIERIFRDRYLTDAEARHYSELRRVVEEEFGAPDVKSASAAGVLTDELRQAIRNSSRSYSDISKQTGISPRMTERFALGERTIPLVVADRIAAALELHLSKITDRAA
jgi:pantothenate kinase type III